jgi:Fe-S protein assembly co-chaperone HscB
MHQERGLSVKLLGIIGHRGVPDKIAENTLASFQYCLNSPLYDGIELDVQAGGFISHDSRNDYTNCPHINDLPETNKLVLVEIKDAAARGHITQKDNWVIISFDPSHLQGYSKTGITADYPKEFGNHLFINYNIDNFDSVSQSHKTTLWTIKTPSQLAKAVKLQADYIMINNDDILLTNPFALFGINHSYPVDKKYIDARYLLLQKHFHPDNGGNSQKSAIVNNFYKIMSSPMLLAEYIMLQEGIDMEQQIASQRLLVQQLELRERLSDGDDEVVFEAKATEKKLILQIKELFVVNNYKEAVQPILELRYTHKLLLEARK